MFRSVMTIGLIMLLCGSMTAGTIKVPADYATIQAGINAAFPGDTVLVADGTYYENIDFKGKAITVASHFLIDGDTTHVDSTIIDGSKPSDPNIGSVVTFQSGEDTTSVLYGFTITGGSGTLSPSQQFRVGGGVFCISNGCKIIANKIINNSVTGPAALGGGLAAVPASRTAFVVLKDNQIEHNMVTASSTMAHSGGVHLECSANIAANSISYNTCIGTENCIQAVAGGIGCFGEQPIYACEIIMENNTVTHNSVLSYCNPGYPFSGGVFITYCNGRMSHNEISYNEVWDYTNLGACAIGVNMGFCPDSFIIDGNIIRGNAEKQRTRDSYGGGINVNSGSGSISVINNIFEGNFADYGGGVLVFETSKVQIVNNTIINNKATYGGGISIHQNATCYVMNTIVWGNQAPTHAGIHVESGSIHVAYCDVQGGWTGTANKNFDPELDADSLLYSSRCIGAGFHSFDFGGGMVCAAPSTDINGRLRPYPPGSKPDIGAWESLLDTVETVGIEQRVNRELPQSFTLKQNYPNPFNPSTTIEFVLPKASFVTLKIYSLLGKEVATLVAEQQSAGIHKFNWDARGLASGVYLYRLQAGEFTQIRKLVLIR
jgi:hypothetical protein